MIRETLGAVGSHLRRDLFNKRKLLLFLTSLVLVFISIWLFFTQTGELARRSFMKSFGQEDHRPQIVTVYSGGEKIMELHGHYSVERYQGRLVLINRETSDYTDIYGESAVVIQTADGAAQVVQGEEGQE